VLVFIEDLVGVNTERASPKTAFDQDPMQIGQCFERDLRRAQGQARTRGRVEHPAGHSDNDAWLYFDVDDLTGGPALAVLPTHPATEQWVPAIKDLDFLPDMGGMNLRWPLAGRTGCSPAACARASGPRPS
jgi:hypothetical protein